MQNYRNLWCSSELILSLPPGLNTETLRCYFSALFHSSGFSKSLVCTTNVWLAALDFTFSSNFSVVTQTISDNYYASHFTTSHSLHIQHWWVRSILNLLYSRKYTTGNLFYIIFTPLFSRHCREEDAPAKCVSLVHACMRKQRSLISEPS